MGGGLKVGPGHMFLKKEHGNKGVSCFQLYFYFQELFHSFDQLFLVAVVTSCKFCFLIWHLQLVWYYQTALDFVYVWVPLQNIFGDWSAFASLFSFWLMWGSVEVLLNQITLVLVFAENTIICKQTYWWVYVVWQIINVYTAFGPFVEEITLRHSV